MELKDLQGVHTLSGVWEESIERPSDLICDISDSAVGFTLDGVGYLAVEESDLDTYSTKFGELRTVLARETMPDHEVRVEFCDGEGDFVGLTFIDTKSNAEVLKFGTIMYEDNLSCFVADWTPENLYENCSVEVVIDLLRMLTGRMIGVSVTEIILQARERVDYRRVKDGFSCTNSTLIKGLRRMLNE